MSLNSQLYMLPEKLDALVKASIDDWKKNDKVRRLWQRDASLSLRRDGRGVRPYIQGNRGAPELILRRKFGVTKEAGKN